MKKTLIPILVAAILWFVMFSPWTAPHLNFWIVMTISACILSTMSFTLGNDWKKQFQFDFKSILIGLGAAILLWFVFYLGDYFSAILFDFAKPQVNSIYGLRDGNNPVLIGLALLLIIGPAEVFFWQGFVQKNLIENYGTFQGFLITTAIYTFVHIWSFNFMLFMAALVCGLAWGLMYAYLQPKKIVPLLIFHAVWDLTVFILFPIL